VLGLTAKIVHLEECDSFLVGIVESVYEMLRYKVPCNLPFFPFTPLLVANEFSLSQALAWTPLVRHVRFLKNHGSREIIRGSQKFVVSSPVPSCYYASLRSCSAHWRGC
jgi:hypothetical protein